MEESSSKQKNTEQSDSDSSSFIGSIANESILVQTIPSLQSTNASSLPAFSDYLSLLFAAIRANDLSTCQRLLESSQNGGRAGKVNLKNSDGLSPLHLSSSLGLVKICELLLDYGDSTDINIRNLNLQTPLHLACLEDHLQVAQLLVRSGAQLNPLDFEGNSPMHIAAQVGNPGLVLWLLGKSPDLSIPNKFAQTPVDLASPQIKDLITEFCLKRGILLNQTDRQLLWHEPTTVKISKLHPLDFEVFQALGKGSFGEVYLVRKRDSGIFYAMKVLRKDKVMRQNLIKYALTERNVLSYIRHPFIVSLNYAFQTSDKLFLILDYCPGRDLASHLSKAKRFDESRARMYLCEVLLAIEELHRRDIIFRDLKPDNIVLDSEGHAMLTDFGLSKEGVMDDVSATSFCGSLAYLAPEMIKRKGHGKAVDWYLLGVLLYEMLIGVPPYFSPKKEELLNNIQRGKLRVPSTMSQEAKELLKGLLTRDPSLRLGSKSDAEEVKQSNFFRGINWSSVMRRELNLPVPEQTSIASSPFSAEHIFGDISEVNENRVSGWTFVSK